MKYTSMDRLFPPTTLDDLSAGYYLLLFIFTGLWIVLLATHIIIFVKFLLHSLRFLIRLHGFMLIFLNICLAHIRDRQLLKFGAWNLASCRLLVSLGTGNDGLSYDNSGQNWMISIVLFICMLSLSRQCSHISLAMSTFLMSCRIVQVEPFERTASHHLSLNLIGVGGKKKSDPPGRCSEYLCRLPKSIYQVESEKISMVHILNRSIAAAGKFIWKVAS